jgi:hypothetical protein
MSDSAARGSAAPVAAYCVFPGCAVAPDSPGLDAPVVPEPGWAAAGVSVDGVEGSLGMFGS